MQFYLLSEGIIRGGFLATGDGVLTLLQYLQKVEVLHGFTATSV